MFPLIQQSIPKSYEHKRSPNVVISTESPNSDDTINAGKKTSTKDIKNLFVLEDSMVKQAQGLGYY